MIIWFSVFCLIKGLFIFSLSWLDYRIVLIWVMVINNGVVYVVLYVIGRLMFCFVFIDMICVFGN